MVTVYKTYDSHLFCSNPAISNLTNKTILGYLCIKLSTSGRVDVDFIKIAITNTAMADLKVSESTVLLIKT